MDLIKILKEKNIDLSVSKGKFTFDFNNKVIIVDQDKVEKYLLDSLMIYLKHYNNDTHIKTS